MNSLDIKLHSIGIRIVGNFENISHEWIDIEKTIIDICYEVQNDGRLFSLLVSWVKVHGNYLITEKLLKLYKQSVAVRGHCPWFNALLAFATLECSHKFSKWVRIEKQKIFWGDLERTIGLIKMKGSIKFLEEINIFVPKTTLRIREKDVLTPEELIRNNLQYKNRYLFGASWRADIVTAIEFGIKNPYQIAKLIGCSYEPANRIFREYNLTLAC